MVAWVTRTKKKLNRALEEFGGLMNGTDGHLKREKK